MPQNLDELFEVVDENDVPVGVMPRRDVHRLKQRHRAVHLLVVNQAGNVFLHKRSMKKDLFPGAWDSSAAGHVGAGEDYDSTAVRELQEELGIQLPADAFQPRSGAPRDRSRIERLFKIEAREETGQEFVWVYRVDAEGPFVLEADEIERGEWFTRTEIDRWILERPQELAPAFLYLWPKARNLLVARDSA
jgi:isopentenyldiphosphate isomerase